MIKKNIPAWQLIGKKVMVERDICNGAGNGIGFGGIATIVNCVQGSGITIKSSKCDCCNQYSVISHISRDELTLIDIL